MPRTTIRVAKEKETMAYKLRIKRESILDIISVKSMRRFIKISAKGMSLKVREVVERLAGAEEAEEIVEGVIEAAEEIGVEEEDAAVLKGTPVKISTKRTPSSPLPNQCKEREIWVMLRILRIR